MRPRTAGCPAVATISALPPAPSIRAATCSAPASMSSSEAETVGRRRKRWISPRCPSKSASIRSHARAQGVGSRRSPVSTSLISHAGAGAASPLAEVVEAANSRPSPGLGPSRPDRGVLQVGHGHGPLGEDGYGGVLADVLQLLGDPGRYVRYRLEVHPPDVVGGYLAVERDPCPLQDQGEELHLPLVEHREPWRVDGLEHILRRGVLEEHLAEVAVVREAVVATGRGEDQTSLGDDLVCR